MTDKLNADQILHNALTMAGDIEIGDHVSPDDIIKNMRDMASLVEVSRRDYEVMYKMYLGLEQNQ